MLSKGTAAAAGRPLAYIIAGIAVLGLVGCAGGGRPRAATAEPVRMVQPVQPGGTQTAEAFFQTLGINAHTGGQGDVDPARFAQIRDLLREYGVRYSRGKITKGNADRARELYSCCRMQTLARIDTRLGSSQKNPVDMDGIGPALDLALSIGPAAIVGFEGPNEYTHWQNTGDWNIDLRNYTQRVYQTVRGRGLGQTIVGPTVFLRRVEEIRAIGDISAWVDASAFHIYTSGFEPSAKLGEYMGDAEIMAPGKPVWVTEFGFHNALADPSANPVSEIAAAKYLPRFVALLFQASPDGKHFLYEFVDEGTDRSDREQNFGLLRYDLSKKPAYHAMKRLIDQVKGGTPGLRPTPLEVQLGGDTGSVRSITLQKGAKQYLVLLWQEVRSWDRRAQADIAVPTKAVTVTLPSPAASVGLVDTLPSAAAPAADAPAKTVASNAATLKVDVPDHIVILDIRL